MKKGYDKDGYFKGKGKLANAKEQDLAFKKVIKLFENIVTKYPVLYKPANEILNRNLGCYISNATTEQYNTAYEQLKTLQP